MFHVMVGDRTSVYDATDYDTNMSVPRVGQLEYDPVYKAFFRFIKNVGASALTEKLVAVAAGADKTDYEVAVAAATDGLLTFAGVRVPGASSMAQNEYGWLQVSGPATFLHSGGAATVADDGIITSASVAGKVEGVAAVPADATAALANAKAVFAYCQAAKTTLDEDVKATIVYSCLGL